MAKIRHIAYLAADVEAMANFFVNAYGIAIVDRRQNGAIDLSDGTINIAVVPVREAGQRPGIDHIGFAVEDEDEAIGRLEAAGARKTGTTFGLFQGPEGIVVEIGQWKGAEPIGEIKD